MARPVAWPLKGQPLSVQTEALRQAAGKRGFAFWMEQGLGKTAVIWAEFTTLSEAGAVDRMLLFVPNSLKINWKMEKDKWGAAGDVHVWPDLPSDARGYDRRQPPVIIANYEALFNKDFQAFMLDFIAEGKCYLGLDEATRIKNHNAQAAKKLIAAAIFATVIREATGSPMVQNVMDLWPQLRVLGGLAGTNPFAFRNKYADMGGFMGKQITGVKDQEGLSKLMSVWGFRALKEDWLDLPPKLYTERVIDMTPRQKKIYMDMLEDFIILVDAKEISAEMVITQQLKLQQIARGYILTGDDDKKIVEIMPPKENPAIQAAVDFVEEASGKVIITTFYRHSTSVLCEALKKYCPVMLIGGMKNAEIERQKFLFNNESKHRVIVLQASVGAMGHTLLGQKGYDRCKSTLFYENSYSLLDRIQVEDRNHRIGQDESVLYCDLIAAPADMKRVSVLRSKKAMASSVVDAYVLAAREELKAMKEKTTW